MEIQWVQLQTAIEKKKKKHIYFPDKSEFVPICCIIDKK